MSITIELVIPDGYELESTIPKNIGPGEKFYCPARGQILTSTKRLVVGYPVREVVDYFAEGLRILHSMDKGSCLRVNGHNFMVGVVTSGEVTLIHSQTDWCSLSKRAVRVSFNHYVTEEIGMSTKETIKAIGEGNYDIATFA